MHCMKHVIGCMRGFNFTVYLSVRPSVCPSVCLSVRLSIYLSMYISIDLYRAHGTGKGRARNWDH